MNPQYAWSPNNFDAEILGVNVAKITTVNDLGSIKKMLIELADNKIEYAHYRLKSNEIEIIQELERNGFIFVDGTIAFINENLGNDDRINSIRLVDPKEIENLKEIASTFHGTRFFNDSRIDKRTATEIYKRWIENSVKDETVQVFVYTDDEKISGFVTVQDDHIVLIAVKSEMQGRGIGKKLVKHALAVIKKNGFNSAYIETQMQNIPAIGAYISNGFKVLDTYVTLAWGKTP